MNINGIRVLQVDDNVSMLEVSKEVLMTIGDFTIDTALSVDEAFQKMAQQTYDVIVSDYEMPQKNGLQFLQELREQHNHIPFIIFTGKGKEEVAMKALNLGADGYYNKQGSTETVYGELAHAINTNAKNKRTEDALIKSEERWAITLESIGDAVISTDTSGKITFMNAVAEKLTGWTLNEASKKPINHVFNIFDELTHQKVEDLVSRVLEKKLITGLVNPAILIRKNGTEVTIDDSAAPILNEAGKITGAGLVFRDITEHKKIEKKLEDNRNKLELMNEKLQVISSLTRHDVRNKLSEIVGYSYLLKKKHKNQVDIIDGLDKMEQAIKSSNRIFDFAILYEQLGVEELTYVDVHKTVTEAVALFAGLNFNVVNDCHGLTVLADSFLRQLFYNLFENTRKYSGKSTTAKVFFEITASGGLQLVYEDDGVGISEENKANLFKEGFSTGGSTGFGLFLIKKMMKVYNWTIQEVGEPGKGAKFIITIPKLNLNGKNNFQIAK